MTTSAAAAQANVEKEYSESMVTGEATGMMSSVASAMMSSVATSMMSSVATSMMSSVASAGMSSVALDAADKFAGGNTALMSSVADV